MNGTATVKAKEATRGRVAPKAKLLKPKVVITPGEAWVMVNRLKINIEYLQKSDQWVATFRNDEKYIYLPVTGPTALQAVEELLAQIGVEVAHG